MTTTNATSGIGGTGALAPNYDPLPLEFARAEGTTVVDVKARNTWTAWPGTPL